MRDFGRTWWELAKTLRHAILHCETVPATMFVTATFGGGVGGDLFFLFLLNLFAESGVVHVALQKLGSM